MWPSGRGRLVGAALEPIDRRVPALAAGDPELHELLALVDAIRVGRRRDIDLARVALQQRLGA